MFKNISRRNYIEISLSGPVEILTKLPSSP